VTDRKYRPNVDFGLGGVALGNEFEFVTDAQAEQTLEAAWEAGVRYFDTSPWYGLGLCERRFGQFLHKKPRDEYILSTKVGKLLKASPANQAKKYFRFTTSPNDPVFDYTADGVRRSVEDSLQRMGLDRIDMLFVHDLSPDNDLLPEDWETLFGIAEKGAFPVLSRMREEGMIKGWGMGVNCPQPILRCLDVADPDICLLASQYSLVDHKTALDQLFPKARQTGVSFVIVAERGLPRRQAALQLRPRELRRSGRPAGGAQGAARGRRPAWRRPSLGCDAVQRRSRCGRRIDRRRRESRPDSGERHLNEHEDPGRLLGRAEVRGSY